MRAVRSVFRIGAVVLGLLISHVALAVDSVDSSSTPRGGNDERPGGELNRAVYTEAGLQRIRDNISLLAENIRDTETNLTNIEKNIQTITNEIAEIKRLVEDYAELRAKFLAKIRTAKEEIASNVEALKKLQKFLKKLESVRKGQGDTEAVKLQQESALRETAERERWGLDAAQKLKKLGEMLNGLDVASKAVRAKQPRLEREIVLWKRQTAEFQGVLESLKNQREEFELLAKAKPATPERSAP